MASCKICNGKGTIREESKDLSGERVMRTIICIKCDGWNELDGRHVDEEVVDHTNYTGKRTSRRKYL